MCSFYVLQLWSKLTCLFSYARIHRLGFRGLAIDDYLMVAAFSCYTALVVCLNLVVAGGGSNLFPPEEFSTFTQEDIDERIKGSKIVVISEQAMLNTIYTIKACMLIMYTRLTMGLRQQRMVKGIAIYVACGWVGTELAFFLACRPFAGYWAVPPPNPQCTTLENFAITQAVFNISSDLLMLGVMLPLLVQVNLPFRQKIALMLIFSMGSFVIIAALLTKIFNLSDLYSTIYMPWYVREASTAMYVANLPLIWPLLREWFPWLRQVSTGYRSTSDQDKPGMSRPTTNDGMGSTSMSRLSKIRSSRYGIGTETDIEWTGSSERAINPPFNGRGIFTQTTVQVDVDQSPSSVDGRNYSFDQCDWEKHSQP